MSRIEWYLSRVFSNFSVLPTSQQTKSSQCGCRASIDGPNYVKGEQGVQRDTMTALFGQDLGGQDWHNFRTFADAGSKVGDTQEQEIKGRQPTETMYI